MGKKRLKSWVIERIRGNGTLYGKIADAIGVRPATMPNLIRQNSEKLTILGAIVVLREELGVQDSELIEYEEAPVKNG